MFLFYILLLVCFTSCALFGFLRLRLGLCFFRRQAMGFEVFNKIVVVSGASQGLGRSLADKLHDRGASLVLLARSKDKLDEIATRHENDKRHHDQFSIAYPIDLADAQQVLQFRDFLRKEVIDPDIVFCCAGSSVPKLFTDLSLEELDAGIDINYKTCLYLLHALVPGMVLDADPHDRANRKHIVILSSSVAFYSFIGYSQYSPMKTALKALGDSLRQELKPLGIKVTTVFPGNFASEGYAEENLTKPSITAEVEGSSKPISVDECSDILLKELDAGTTYIHTDFIGWVLNCFSLGFGPRSWWPFQIVLALVGALFARLIDLYHESLIAKWYASNKKGGSRKVK